MRVLAVTNMYPTAETPGAGTFIEQQIKGLRQIGLDVNVLHLDRRRKGMKVYLRMTRQLRREIDKSQPDVVHAMYGGVMADQVTRIVTDRATVVTLHGSDVLGEHLSGIMRKVIAGYGVWASWQAAKRAQRVITVSNTLKNVLPRDIDRSKVEVIPNGIDLARFKPIERNQCRRQLGWLPQNFHVLFPANSGDPVKRPELAQAAVNCLWRSGIRAEMHCLRGIPNSEVPLWINASHVVLLTSLHEGSPTIIKEALACNTPVVSVDVGDVSERLNGIEGCYIALPDPIELAAKLALVYADRGSVAGRERMEEFSLEHIARRIHGVYQNALRSPNGKECYRSMRLAAGEPGKCCNQSNELL